MATEEDHCIVKTYALGNRQRLTGCMEDTRARADTMTRVRVTYILNNRTSAFSATRRFPMSSSGQCMASSSVQMTR